MPVRTVWAVPVYVSRYRKTEDMIVGKYLILYIV